MDRTGGTPEKWRRAFNSLSDAQPGTTFVYYEGRSLATDAGGNRELAEIRDLSRRAYNAGIVELKQLLISPPEKHPRVYQYLMTVRPWPHRPVDHAQAFEVMKQQRKAS